MSVLVVRVSNDAAAAAAGPDRPVRSSSISISVRRFENKRRTRSGMPMMSASPLSTSVHSTPNRRVNSLRSTD